jgi:chromosome partitioning protein
MDRAGRRVAVAQQKGGVGKTTSTINLARAASVAGHRVLVIDMDPQGNASSALASEPLASDQVSVADAIVPGTDVALVDVLVPSMWPNVDLAPSAGETLATAEHRIGAAPTGREHRLAEALDALPKPYDLVLVDCPPALGQLTVNALAAVDRVLVVAEGDQWSADGLAMLRRTVEGVQRYTNPNLRWAGVLVNKWRGTASEVELVGEIAEFFTEAEVWPERVPLWVGIKDAINAGRGLDEAGSPRLRVLADDYRAMVGRLLDGVR